MSAVEWVPFGRLFDLARRTPDWASRPERIEIGLRSFGNGPFHKPPVSVGDLGSKKVFQVRAGDLLISNIFAWEGAVAIAGPREAGLVGSHRFMTWTATRSDLETRYVMSFLLSKTGLDAIGAASPGSAGRNRTLGVEALKAITIPLPDLATQRAIADRLEGVAATSQRIATSHDSSGPAKLQLDHTLASSLEGEMLRSVATPVSRPHSVESDRTYDLLGVRWYGEGLFVRETKPGREMRAPRLYEVNEGDLIYNRLFAWKGSFAITPEIHGGAHVSSEFPTFRVDVERFSAPLLAAWLTGPTILAIVEKQSTGSTPTSRNRFSIERFLELPIPTLDANRQAELARQAGRVKQISSLTQQRRALTAALLPAARNEEFARLLD